MLIGNTIIQQLKQLLQWVLKGIWTTSVIIFWLLIQQIELFAWFVAEISTQIKQLHHHLKPGLTQNFQILLAPLLWLLQNIWGLLVASVWLLFQLIELTAWYLSRLRQLPQWLTRRRRGTRHRPGDGETGKLGDFSTRNVGSMGSNIPPTLPTPPPPMAVSPSPRLHRPPISPHLIFVTLMLLCLSGVVVAEILPAMQLFEANVIAQSVNFRYAGTDPQPLLREVHTLEEISITGRQTITLVGAFASSVQPGMPASSSITVELAADTSNFTLKPLGTARELQLKDVLLREGTAVRDLSYRAPENRLSLTLQPEFRTNALAINLGSQPLQVSLKGYRILAEGSAQQTAVDNELEFNFTPTAGLLSLSLPEVAKLSIILADITPNSQWLGGNLTVADLGFASLDSQRLALAPTGRYGGNNSTILSGEVRMAGKAMKLGKNQFFIAGTPGIQKVRYWQIDEEKSAIVLGMAGKSTAVAVGLDPDFPVERIKVSYLRLWFPESAVAALIPVATALGSYLLYWLLDRRQV